MRFDDAVSGLSQEQLNWRLHPGTLSIGEAAIHVAGVEVSFISQLLGTPLDAHRQRVREASTEGVIDETPFPFSAAEITPELVAEALAFSRQMVEPVITNPGAEVLDKQIKSALGPMIDGRGAFARLAYHPGYHQGHVHIIRTAPGFPAG